MTAALQKLINNGIYVTETDLINISIKYKIRRMEVFGSVLTSDFTQDSDIDLLVTFDEDTDISLFDLMDLESEMSNLFNRPVDIVEPAALKNPIRRKNILTSCELIYAA